MSNRLKGVACGTMLQHICQSVRRDVSKETKRYYASYKIVRIQPLEGPNKKIAEINPETQQEALNDVLAPLWKLPYAEQLNLKDQWIPYVVSQYYNIMREHFSNSKNPRQLPPRPKIKTICPSPVTTQYRTKDCYMVRPGIDGDPKTVGHIVGRPSEGKYVCVPPTDLLSPTRHSEVAKAFQGYIRTSSLKASENFADGGNWIQIHVRSNSEGDTMALVKFHPQQLTQVEIEDECRKMREYFLSGPGSGCALTSLYFQSSPFSNASSAMAPFQLLFGNKFIMEKLSGRDFALSPGSFFQCNREMAEIMYAKVFTAAGLSKSTSVLDLGCGIGTISILASPFVRGTVGIDSFDEAIRDAEYNARLNNIHSANFITGTIEKKLKVGLKLLQPSSHIVAILNPGRCGIEVSAMKLLRDTPQIGTVIYVACQPNHEWVIRNVLALIKPEAKTLKGKPFTFKSVIPVDMFPQTVQCEVIMKFER